MSECQQWCREIWQRSTEHGFLFLWVKSDESKRVKRESEEVQWEDSVLELQDVVKCQRSTACRKIPLKYNWISSLQLWNWTKLVIKIWRKVTVKWYLIIFRLVTHTSAVNYFHLHSEVSNYNTFSPVGRNYEFLLSVKLKN